jgi:hypothetical protein
MHAISFLSQIAPWQTCLYKYNERKRWINSQSIQSDRLPFQPSELGPTHPLTRKGVLLFPNFGSKGGRHTRLRGEGVGGQKSDAGTDAMVLCVYCNPSTGKPNKEIAMTTF